MTYRSRYDGRQKAVDILFGIPCVALLVASFGASIVPLQCYMLAAVPFYIVTSDLVRWGTPDFGSRWFWQSYGLIAAMVAFAVYGWFQFSGLLRDLDVQLPTRMLFGYVTVAAILEAFISIRIVKATRPKQP